MRIGMAAAAVALAAAVSAPVAVAQEHVVERAFAAGGTVHLDLAAGGYKLTGTDANRIRIQWRTRRPSDVDRVGVRAEVNGTTARISTSRPRDGLFVEIELPSRTSLVLSLSAGDLLIRGIEGSKDVSVWAGDVGIEVGEPAQYRSVHASVQMGDLSARPFNVSKGGLFRTFRTTGKGPYDLRARLFAGDLTLLK
jgi:hypothetical protein